MYKLIALDMDGTLLNEDKKISKANLEAIRFARKKGIKIVLATGRPTKGIEKYLKELDLIHDNEYVVSYNGALVQEVKSGRVIAQNTMSYDDLMFLFDISKKLNVNIHALTLTSCVTPKINDYSILEATMNHIPLEVVDFNCLDKNTTIVKVMFVDPEKKLNAVISQLPESLYEKYTVVRSAPFFLEFLNKKVNKGVGVELLAKKLGIKKEEIICVGDAENDIHMIKYAGLGVAMGNAFPEVKKIADYITKTNQEDGVAHVIKKFIMNKETA